MSTDVQRHGVVVVNVGTPDDPSVASVRRYLAEFLDDPKVIDLPTWARWLLLNVVILPFRPKRSAHAYRQIWTERGSPLLLHSQAQVEALKRELPTHEVVLAMRYGNPSLRSAMDSLRAKGVTHVTLVPMYPQYAHASTGTTLEHFEQELKRHPPLQTSSVEAFHGNDGFITALSTNVRHTMERIDAQYVLFSYHGLPVSHHQGLCDAGCVTHAHPCGAFGARNAKCYRGQCHATTERVVKTLGLTRSSTSFQSRLKGQKWIRPFTDEVIVQLAQQGVRRLAVACPSFVADCLETLEEIGQRAEQSFRAAGGERLELVPAVNDSTHFISALAQEILNAGAATADPSPHGAPGTPASTAHARRERSE